MALIELNLGEGLSTSKLQVKLDETDENNELFVANDGLYVSSGIIPDKANDLNLDKLQNNYAVTIDYSPWGYEYSKSNGSFQNHITCDCKTHRIWTAEWDKPDDEENRLPIKLTGRNKDEPFRSKIDWVLPGDFFRVRSSSKRYQYYIITEVSADGASDQDICGTCGQIIFENSGTCDTCGSLLYEEGKGPEICPECGQPIYKPTVEDPDELVGLPGNHVTKYASLGPTIDEEEDD